MSKAAAKVSGRIIRIASNTGRNDQEINVLQAAVEEAVSLMTPQQRKALLTYIRDGWRQFVRNNS
jgi:hypothetical protein